MIHINLLPVRAEKRRENIRKHVLLVIGYLVLVFAVVAVVHFAINGRIEDVNRRIAQQKADIARLDKIIAEVKDYEKKIKDLSEKIQIINELKLQQRGPARAFHEIALLVPEKVWIESLSDNNGLIQINGYAIDNQTIARFMDRLERSTLFTKIHLQVAKKQAKGGTELKAFSMDVTVVPPKPPVAQPTAPTTPASQGAKKAG